MNDEPIEITLLVIDVLEKLGINYLLAGSLASSIYGEPRATRDADILADIKPEHVQHIFELLETDFNISQSAIEDALKYRSSFNAIHYQSLFKIDVFVPKDRLFDKQELQRRVLRVVAQDPERRAYVCFPEQMEGSFQAKWNEDSSVNGRAIPAQMDG